MQINIININNIFREKSEYMPLRKQKGNSVKNEVQRIKNKLDIDYILRETYN